MDTQITQRYSKVDLFSVKGRMGSKYYLFYSIAIPLVFFWFTFQFTGVLSTGMNNLSLGSALLLGVAISIVLFILVYLTIQRCHDFDKSGWYAMFALIPFANLFYASVPQVNGLNRYGEMPEPAPVIISVANYFLVLLVLGLSLFLLFHFLGVW